MFYFAYGSNMDPDHMHLRVPGALLLGPALLPDWQLGFRYKSTSFPGGGAADILPRPGSETWGILWRITDLRELDRYEDVPWGYQRQEIRIRFRGHTPLVWTYSVANKLPDDLRPTEEYYQLIRRGSQSLPKRYQTLLEKLYREAGSSPSI